MFGLEPDGRTRTRAEWAALLMPRFHPDDVGRQVSGDEGRLYELIWMRTIASQISSSTISTSCTDDAMITM